MDILSEGFGTRWEQSLIPLKSSFAISVSRRPSAVYSDNAVAEILESKINQTFGIDLDDVLGRPAVVVIVAIPSHWWSGRFDSLAICTGKKRCKYKGSHDDDDEGEINAWWKTPIDAE